MIKKYIIASEYDEEGFDYDGAGDYIYTATNYREHETKKEALAYLKKIYTTMIMVGIYIKRKSLILIV